VDEWISAPKSKSCYNRRLLSLSWCRTPSWAHDQILVKWIVSMYIILTVYLLLQSRTQCVCIYNIYKFSVSSVFAKQIMCNLCYNVSWVFWTVVTLTPPSLSLSYFLCLSSPCPIPRTCLSSWLLLVAYKVLLHNDVHTEGWRTGEHLGKLPRLRRTLFFRLWKFIRCVCVANSQAEEV
jgi:hypothetical protein